MAAVETIEGYRTPAPPPPPRRDEPAEPAPRRRPLPRATRLGLAVHLVLASIAVGLLVLPLALAALLPAFRRYVRRSRVREAEVFLEEIRLREEAYRAEFGEYAALDWSEATVPGSEPVPWTGSREWKRLGAAPDGPVRFRYRVLTGSPSVSAHSFVMQAEADLDGDGDTMAIVGDSSTYVLHVSRGLGGPPLPEGWE